MVGSDSSHGISRVVRHKDFYLRGGDMTVLVENHLYRIHSYFFERESLFFRQKFSSANNVNGDEERGLTDEDAYTLEDVKSEDFARFLWVFYNPKYSVYDAPLETWLSILTLANRWTFDSVKELAVRELEKIEIEAVEKISIYHSNGISRLYLIPSYIAVCKRDKPLSFKEGMSLGMETVLRIAEARERLRLRASESGIRTPTFEDFEDNEVEVLIREIFNLGVRPNTPSSATSPTNGTNGPVNGTHVKLGPPPASNPRVHVATASRPNGGSAADPKGSSVDSMRSFTSAMRQGSGAAASATQTPVATQATGLQPTVPQVREQRNPPPPVPPVKTTLTSPLLVPLATADKAEGSRETPQDANSLFSPKPGVGEPSSPADSNLAGSHDVSNSRPVVPSSDHNDDVTAKSDDNVNDVEKDELSKDNDTASVLSDNEAVKSGKQGQKKRAQKNATRGGKKP